MGDSPGGRSFSSSFFNETQSSLHGDILVMYIDVSRVHQVPLLQEFREFINRQMELRQPKSRRAFSLKHVQDTLGLALLQILAKCSWVACNQVRVS